MSNDLKSANSVKTGKKFSESRIKQNYSINDIAEKLYVNKDYISAIEKGNFSIFPSKAFAKAYFQKYKEFLGIKCDFPDIYINQKSEETVLKNLKKEIKLPYSWNEKIKIPVAISISIITLSILMFIVFKDSSTIYEEQSLSKQINVDDLKLIEQNILKNKSSNLESVNDNSLNKLILFFDGDTWIELYINNDLIKAQQFEAGDSYSRTVKTPFKIIVGNADSVKGTYNNQVINFSNNNNLLNEVSTAIFDNE